MYEFIAARLPFASAPPVPRAITVVDDFESGTLAGWTLDRRDRVGMRNGRNVLV
jgi:hypothetical protein